MGDLTNEDFAELMRQTPMMTPHMASGDTVTATAKQRNRERYNRILKQQEFREKKEQEKSKFRDRAAERRFREQVGQLETAELQAAKKLSEEESKHLGGDIQHTHLVKGLDYILLEKVRTEMELKNAMKQVESVKNVRKPAPEMCNLAKQLVNRITKTLHPHSVKFNDTLHDLDYVILKGHQLKSFHTNPLRNIVLQFKLDDKNDLPPILVHQARNTDKEETLSTNVRCLAPIHWIISKQLKDVSTYSSKDILKDIPIRTQVESFQNYMSNFKPFTEKKIEPWSFSLKKPSIEIKDDEDIFSGVGGFKTEDISSNFDSLPPEKPAKHFQRTSSLERMQYFSTSLQDTPEPESEYISRNAKISLNLAQEPTKQQFVIDDGYDDFQAYDSDDDFVSQNTKKLKSSKELRKQAERQYKKIGKVLESNSYRDLDALQKEISNKQFSSYI